MINIKELASQTKEIRVLYVEDEEIVREQMMITLSILFDTIDSAFDGEDGWQKFQTAHYDIIMTDISMPQMDGLELLRKVKETNPFQKVIIISAHNTAEHLFTTIELGVDGFILKPLSMDKLLLNIKKISDSILAIKFMHNYQEKLEEEIEKKTEIIKQQIVNDKFTGLQNRFALNQVLENLKNDALLILLNIDNLDSINTIYGYKNGNKVIYSVANILSKNLRQNTKLFYLNIDEFAIVSDIFETEEIERYVKDLQSIIMNHSIDLNENSVKITVTIGLAIERENLLQNAHIALKEAKSEGKNRIKWYNNKLNIEKLQHQIQKFGPIIRDALRTDDVVPYFQPIVYNRTKKICKYECLARIVKEECVYSPFHFIDVAQMIGLLPEITKVMIDKSFKVFQNNQHTFSINITEIDLNDNYLYDYLSQKLQEYNIAASRVILEVLEGISTTAVDNSLNQLKRLKKMGFSIAIDDFGAQNSNFERVNSMNVDFIKIDGSFVKYMAEDEKSYSIVKTITDFSKSIGAKVIAEFVHNEAVQQKVEELEIEYSQGYYFSEPKDRLIDEI